VHQCRGRSGISRGLYKVALSIQDVSDEGENDFVGVGDEDFVTRLEQRMKANPAEAISYFK
jgi:hypothetical protein